MFLIDFGVQGGHFDPPPPPRGGHLGAPARFSITNPTRIRHAPGVPRGKVEFSSPFLDENDHFFDHFRPTRELNRASEDPPFGGGQGVRMTPQGLLGPPGASWGVILSSHRPFFDGI